MLVISVLVGQCIRVIKDVRMVKVQVARALVVKDARPVVVWSCKGPSAKLSTLLSTR